MDQATNAITESETEMSFWAREAGIVHLDHEARILACNNAFVRMYGFMPREVSYDRRLVDLLLSKQSSDKSEFDLHTLFESLAQNVESRDVIETFLDGPCGRKFRFVTQRTPRGGWISIHEDISETGKGDDRTAKLIEFDPLTVLPGRLVLSAHIDHALRAAVPHENVVLLIIGIDRFHAVNDAYGFGAGSQLLSAYAHRLAGQLGNRGMLARLGGDTFAIMMPKVARALEATAIANAILELATAPFAVGDDLIELSVSIGIAEGPEHGQTGEKLIQDAELALHKAKRQSGNQYCFFEWSMDDEVAYRSAMEQLIRKAITQEKFEVWYQPIVNVETGEVVELEALIRLRDDVAGLISPDQFIPLSEQNGMIIPITEQLLRRACADALTWPDHIRLSVNISPVQFNRKGAIAPVISILKSIGFPPERLSVEITETALLEQDQALENFNALRTYGVSMSLDDYGAGYSSISYLKKFKFDKIKIDSSLIKDLSISRESTALVRAVTSLANAMKVDCVAEGVERGRQVKFVKMLGCQYAQGYYYSPPRTAQDIQEILKKDALDAEPVRFEQTPALFAPKLTADGSLH